MQHQPPGLRLNLMSENKLEDDGARRPSSTMDLHGIDITALDARDIHLSTATLTPLPASPDDREREQAKSFFGNHTPSPAAPRNQEDSPVTRQDTTTESRSKSISNWMYSHRKASGSTQGLSLRRKDSDSQEGSAGSDGESFYPFTPSTLFARCSEAADTLSQGFRPPPVQSQTPIAHRQP